MRIKTLVLFLFAVSISFSQNRGFTLVDKTGKETGTFGSSWGLVIGINDYEEGEIPKLRYAVNDAQGVSDLLIKDQGFEKDKVLILMNAKATKDNIIKSFEFLKQNAAPDDRLVVFFAGHGITLPTPGGREKGYILPVDARINSYATTCLSVDQLNEWSEQIRSKHIYFVMDACYGGTIFTRATSLSADAQEYYDVITSRTARQAITAGGRDQQVMDTGDEGHSVFTFHFISGIEEGLADLNGDGIITAGEIASYVAPQVTASSKSQQTPEYGSIAGSKGGEFVFLAPKTTFKKKPIGKEQQIINFNTLMESDEKMSIAVERIFSTESMTQIGFKYPINIQKLTKKSLVFFLIPNVYAMYIGTTRITYSSHEADYSYNLNYLKGVFYYDIMEYRRIQLLAHINVTQMVSEIGETTYRYLSPTGSPVITKTATSVMFWGMGANMRLRFARLAFTIDGSYTFNKGKNYADFIGLSESAQIIFNYAQTNDVQTNHSNFNVGIGVELLL